ncbi:MAG: site-specific integrase [Cyclobacteriaceae bacterium]
MGVTFKPVFNRLNTKNKSGLYSIHVRVTIDRETNYINPKLVKIESRYWAGRQNKWVKESHPNSYEINSLLQRKLGELDTFIVRNKIMGRPISFTAINDFYFKQGDGTIFNEYVSDYIRNLKGMALNTLKVYGTFQKHLNRFNPKIKFSDLSENLLNEFKEYLQSEAGLKGGATKKYFDKLKVICKDAVKQGYLEVNRNPFYYSDVKIKVEKPRRTYLEIEEIRSIANLELGETPLSKHRDHFLFMVFTGLYYKDLKNLTKMDLNRNKLGTYIIGNRIKNENAFIIPVYKFPIAEGIITKYASEVSHLVFPDTISDQKFNEHLKTLAAMAGVGKTVTNKVARHSYAQLWMSKGAERQFVSKLLGHTEEDTTQEYYNISIHDVERKLSAITFDEF